MNHNHEDKAMLSDPALDDLFAELRGLANRPTPPVSEALAAVFAGATPLAAARTRRSKAVKTSLVGLVAVGIMGGGITAAAAANQLPDPAQRIVSRVVNTLTPLNIPNPDEQGPVEHQTDTDLDDNGDQPGQDIDQPGQNIDQPGQGGTQDGESDNQDQQDGQTDQSGGDNDGSQSNDPDPSGEGADQPNGGGTSGGSGTTGQTGSTSTDSDADGGQQGGGSGN